MRFSTAPAWIMVAIGLFTLFRSDFSDDLFSVCVGMLEFGAGTYILLNPDTTND